MNYSQARAYEERDGIQPPWRKGDPQGVVSQHWSCISREVLEQFCVGLRDGVRE